jgi:uncharacterized protein (TIGR02145 family)
MRKLFSVLGIILIIILAISCEKKPVPPSISTTIVTGISTTTAISGGNITTDGGASVISRGVCWNTSDDPTTENSKTMENGDLLSFTSNITQLTPNTPYYVRAYATNSAGIGYGKSVSFKTLGDKPALNVLNASNITINSATLTGSVNPNYLPTTVTFEYGLSTIYGSTATALESPVSGDRDENVAVKADLSGLTPGTNYHVRIKAENSLGITYSSDLPFTTLGQIPSATTQSVTNIQVTQVRINGFVNSHYLPTEVFFEWGTTTNYGNTLALTHNPVEGNNPVFVFSELSGLVPMTTYHVRIKATNELGTVYGDDLTFKTFAAIDADGSGYYSILINTQTWLTKNLRTSKYNNGDLIGTTNPSSLDISGESTPKYQWASLDNENNVSTYGRLYTWNVVVDSRGICPAGWHVPSETEWITLVDYLGGEAVAGSKLKETGNNHWDYNSDATNESGFTALPGGTRFSDGRFWGANHAGVFWNTTPYINPLVSRVIVIYGDRPNIDYHTQKKESGQSIRCIKD